MAKQAREYFRFHAETARKISEIADHQGGLARVRVVELAVDRLWDAILGPKGTGSLGRRKPDFSAPSGERPH